MNTNTHWPAPYRCAVAVTIDYYDIHGILAQYPALAGREKSLSVWRYGTTRGVDRLLDMLEKNHIPATWCMPAIVAEEQPGHLARIRQAGHDVACSGYQFCDFNELSAAEQIAQLRLGSGALAACTGKRPTGFRTPMGQWKPGFAEALSDTGITWTSSWRGDDLPYTIPGTAVVELPLHYELEDDPYFAFNLSPAIPVGQSRIASYTQTLGNMKMDFAAFHRFGLCYVLRLHPEIIGTAGRIGLLQQLFDYMRTFDGVWFASAADIAQWWQQLAEPNPNEHPANVFFRHTEYGANAQ
jgi:peptidoglycan/xylan/chitin deacetylase (PgdA/CDA1 family)